MVEPVDLLVLVLALAAGFELPALLAVVARAERAGAVAALATLVVADDAEALLPLLAELELEGAGGNACR